MHNQSEIAESPAKTILIVDDDPDIREIVVQYIQAETPYQFFAVPDGLVLSELRAQKLIKDQYIWRLLYCVRK